MYSEALSVDVFGNPRDRGRREDPAQLALGVAHVVGATARNAVHLTKQWNQPVRSDGDELVVTPIPAGLERIERPVTDEVQVPPLGTALVKVEDDIAGEVNPGEAVQITGKLVLDLEQSGADATIPDTYVQGIAVEHSDYLPVEISDEEKRRIVGGSDGPDIYEKMVGSLAPVIQGYEIEKLRRQGDAYEPSKDHLRLAE